MQHPTAVEAPRVALALRKLPCTAARDGHLTSSEKISGRTNSLAAGGVDARDCLGRIGAAQFAHSL